MGDIKQNAEAKLSASDVGSRASLFEVLMFLERRGASEATIEMAMCRAGLHADVARLLVRCRDTSANEEMVAIEQPQRKADLRTFEDRIGRASELALRHIGAGVWTIFLVLGVGVAVGVAIGYEFGLHYGIEDGLERLALKVGGN